MHRYAQRFEPVSKYLTCLLESKEHVGCSIHDFCLNHPNRILNRLRENESGTVYVSEGLIKTFPVEKLIKAFRSWYRRKVNPRYADLSFSDIVEKHDRTDELNDFLTAKISDIVDFNEHLDSDNKIVTFYIPFKKDNIEEYNMLLCDLCDSLYVCGYNLTSDEIIKFDEEYLKRNDVSVMYATFEPKFSNFDFEFTEYLYHVTPVENLKKISRNGLTPKSRHGFFKYPDRVYLFTDCSMGLILDYGVDVSDRSMAGKFAMLRVCSEKLMADRLYIEGRTKFYIDQKYPMSNGKIPMAIYTYSNVPSRLIEDEIVVFDVEYGRPVNKSYMSLKEFQE